MTNGTGGATGVSKTVSWIMALIGAAILAMAGFILQGFSTRLTALEATSMIEAQAITRLEANQQSARERDAELLERLKEIERKLDELRARRYRGRGDE